MLERVGQNVSVEVIARLVDYWRHSIVLTGRSSHDGTFTPDMNRLTTGLRSAKCVVRLLRRCAIFYLRKPRQYSTACFTPRLYGIAYCFCATNLCSMLLY